MNKLNSMKKIAFSWWVATSIVIGIMYMVFYSTDLGIATTLLIITGNSLLVAALILYETKVHLSLILLFASELMSHLGYLSKTKAGEAIVTAEFALGTVCMFSGVYLIIKLLRTEKRDITISNILKANIEPFRTPNTAKVIITSLIVTTIFTIAYSNLEFNSEITLMTVAISLLPTFILLLSVTAVRDAVYLRILYYILQISIIIMAVSIAKANIAMFIEPTIYMLSIVLGRIYYISKEVKRETKLISIEAEEQRNEDINVTT